MAAIFSWPWLLLRLVVTIARRLFLRQIAVTIADGLLLRLRRLLLRLGVTIVTVYLVCI